MQSFIVITGLAALAAAAPRGFPPADRESTVADVATSINPGGFELGTGSAGFPTPTGSGFPFPSGSGFPFPSGSGFLPSRIFGSGGLPFPTGFFPGHHHEHHHHPSGSFTGAETTPSLTARNAQFESDIRSGSGSATATTEPVFSFTGIESGHASATGFGGEKPSFSFTFGGSESGHAAPTGFGGEHHHHHHESAGSAGFPRPTETASAGFLTDDFGHHHHEGTGSFTGFAYPTGGFSSDGFSVGTLSFKQTETGTFSFAKPTESV